MLVLGALLVRGSVYALRGDYLGWDEALYLLMAQNILDGSGVTLNGLPHVALSPFVAVLTALVSRVSGLELLTAHRSLMTLAGASFLIPVWYLMRLHAGEHVARIGALLLVGWPALIDVVPKQGPMWRHLYAGSEPLFLALLFTSFAIGEAALRQRGPRRYGLSALAGVSLAFGFLTRPEAVAIAAVYAAIRLLPGYQVERPRVHAAAIGVAATAFLLVAGPHLVHLRQATGSWMLSGRYEPTHLSADLYQDLVRDDRHMGAYLRTWWALDPGHSHLVNPYWGVDPAVPVERRLTQFAQVIEAEGHDTSGASGTGLKRFAIYFAALWMLTGPFYLLFVLVGLARRKTDMQNRFPPFVLAALVASWLTAWQLFVLPRFFLYLVPALALWAARGVVLAAGFVRARGLGLNVPDRLIPVALTVVGIVLVGRAALTSEAASLRQIGIENRLAAERLAAVLPKNEPVFTWHPRLAYWGHLDWRALPVASLDAVAHYGALRGVRFFFLARGAYSPLELTAPYVLLTMDPEVASRLRRISSRDSVHEHPPLELASVEPIAGFPTGRIGLAPDSVVRPAP